MKYGPDEKVDELIYDVRPEVRRRREIILGEDAATAAVDVKAEKPVLKSWVIPTGNDFISDPTKRYSRPEGNPGSDFPFVQATFNDASWEQVDLPHDWAIKGPFYEGWGAKVSGGMGRLPSPGVAWYRKKLDIPASDAGKSLFLDIDGAMSYAMVWLNGKLAGGWPYGYNSWRVDLTPYVVPGGENQLAIRLDNPNDSSRWYSGGGIYRNVWLVKTSPVHVAHWGTYVTTPKVSKSQAKVDLEVTIDNDSKKDAQVEVFTRIFALDKAGRLSGKAVATMAPTQVSIDAGSKGTVSGTVTVKNPRLWGPPPQQVPNRYVAVTVVAMDGKVLDQYETPFGIRSLEFNGDKGLLVNGEHVFIKGVNLHHDHGALGGALNMRAAQRQLEILQEMGCNAIRTAHNTFAPEFYQLTDKMGFLVMDEVFDVWNFKKPALDFHLIFPEWHEQDLRSMIRRDRNSPSVIMWSFGNEVGEQYRGAQEALTGKALYEIAKDEDPTRPATSAMNVAKPDSAFAQISDVISLNYQGEGMRWDGAYAKFRGNKSATQYQPFHEKFPDRVILSSENSCVFTSRGEYFFPVFEGISAPFHNTEGAADSKTRHVSSYELYTEQFGASADKVFAAQEKHPFVAGGFVWTGWDYLGEPSPFYESRSSYYGIVDLAGFPKNKYYLYQSHWRPDLPMAHILPHWNWPDRIGKVTPVHVFTSGDQAELFLNGKSLGRKTKGQYEYRLRRDDVTYEPGELKVVAYKDGKQWATDTVKTTGDAAKLLLEPDRATIASDGYDLSFVTLTVADNDGLLISPSKHPITFEISGPGEIVATDNGDPTDMTVFSSHERKAVKVNRQYLLAHNPDRLLAPFRRESGLEPKAKPYGNWESDGLDGHSAGHYLSALALMIASGADPDGEFNRRLDTMLDELEQCQKAYGDGYMGGVPRSRQLWNRIASGDVDAIRRYWVPWYNVHKTFAGLRDAYQLAGKQKARILLIGLGDWCVKITSGLTDEQMQRMIGMEYGGMNEVMADVYAITGEEKYRMTATRFNHRAVFDPLVRHEDRLTGLHANTQIPKIVGMERIAALTGNTEEHAGAEFFWQTVTKNRCVAFGGNSVSEHFNDPQDFSGMIGHREGPESCNTYNMLRLTELLFKAEPKAAYVDYYERALYNHTLASIHPMRPGYVYFTSIRPDHYRVYSQPEQAFWCCVGTGMENPGRYGEFIYAQAKDGLYVNLFIPSELSVPDHGMVLRQETTFPDEACTQLGLQLEKPTTFTLNIRHPAWVEAGDFSVKVNGQSIAVESTPSSYAAIRHQWKNGDTVDVALPMHTRVERLPDGSDWVAILYGPIVLAKPDGTENMDGLFANDGRMAHVAHGPMVPLDKVPALLTTEEELLSHVAVDPSAGPLHFRIKDVIEPAEPGGLPLVPFFRLHERRYQMYWELTTAEQMAARKEKLAAQERASVAREAATLDWIAVGLQQPEVEHDLQGEGMASGVHNGRRWRHGAWIQYTLDPRGAKEVILAVTYSGDDRGREFDILVNGTVIATQRLTGEKPNHFIEKCYPIASEILQAAGNDRLTVRFVVKRQLAGGLYDVRLLKPGTPEVPPFN